MSVAGWYRPGEAAEPSHAEVIAEMAQSRVVLLGERHDRAEIHRWQLHVAAGLLSYRPLIMGFEMLPARLDPVLEEWVNGALSEEAFLTKAEWGDVWGFAPELYLPLFRFCRETRTPMRGLNVRRGLVREVGKGGWESVPVTEREGLTPARPSPEPYRCYIYDLTGGGPAERKAKGPMDPAFYRFVRAQEVWDRAFATHIARDVKPGGALVVGIIGQGHLQWGGGVSWQLSDLGIEGTCVALTQAAEVAPLEKGAADFVFRLPEGDDALAGK